jgi:hypothetical protein
MVRVIPPDLFLGPALVFRMLAVMSQIKAE